MLQAYLDHLAVAPGGRIGVHASASGSVTGRVDRLLHSDPNPRGPGVLKTTCDWGEISFDGVPCDTHTGSYGMTEQWLPPGGVVTITAWVWPSDLGREATLLSWMSAAGQCSLSLREGRLAVGQGTASHLHGTRLREREWHFVGVAIVAGEGEADEVSLFAGPWGRTAGPYVAPTGRLGVAPSPQSPLVVGARLTDDGPVGSFDGRITALSVHDSALDPVALMFEMNGDGAESFAAWDFADRSLPDRVPPLRADGHPLTLHQGPAWNAAGPPEPSDGRADRFRRGSVHFHTDDVEDCGWPLVAELVVPAQTGPGFYTLSLSDEDGSHFELPFVIRGSAPVTFLAPTLTWQAYSNLGRRADEWPGLSHYDLHGDGSPVIVTTSRKPSPTFAPSARLEVDADDGFATGLVATHLLMADLYADYWLGLRGDHGVVDDRAIHEGGALEDVSVLVLSAHPEYWTAQMLDELDAFVDRGGNVIYLGGNGLYWVTSLHPTRPHLMEVRRWGGSQTCSVEPGDRDHQFEVRRGGLWADNGRPSNATVGVEFTAFGSGDSLTYRRTEASYDPEWSWVFEGVEREEFGDGGLNSGAGNELDRVPDDPPPGIETVVLATTHLTDRAHFSAFEQGADVGPAATVRADIAVSRTRGGGLVLALGAITASGCLPIDEGDNPISRICNNVMDRMLDKP